MRQKAKNAPKRERARMHGLKPNMEMERTCFKVDFGWHIDCVMLIIGVFIELKEEEEREREKKTLENHGIYNKFLDRLQHSLLFEISDFEAIARKRGQEKPGQRTKFRAI